MLPVNRVLLLLFLVLLLARRRYPKLSFPLLLLLASTLFSRVSWEVGGVTVRLEQLACLLFFGCVLFDLLLHRRTLRLPPASLLVLAMLPLVFLSSLLVSPSPLFSLRKSLLYLPYFCAFFALIQVLDSAERLADALDFFYRCTAWVVLCSIPFLWLYLPGVDIGLVHARHGALWLVGPMAVANICGSTAVLAFIIGLGRFLLPSASRPLGWFDRVALFSITAAVILSYTRAAWFGLLLGLVLLVLSSARRMPLRTLLRRAASPLLAVALAAALVIPLHGALNSRFRERGIGGKWVDKVGHLLGKKGPVDWRSSVFENAWRDWRRSPLIGRGSESLVALRGNPSWDYIPITSLALLHDWGALALLLYGGFLLLVLVRLSRALASRGLAMHPGEVPVLLTLLIVSTLIYQVSTTRELAIFWVFLAIFGAGAALFFVPAPSFGERRYYAFGLGAGLSLLRRYGFRLGTKKTFGKIFQPVNAYSRFPEYALFEEWLAPLWEAAEGPQPVRLLDVGSPKLLGLYLAHRFPVKVWLTDIDPGCLEEYRLMWGALQPRSRGEVCFEAQDARSLAYADGAFDGVYSLSVVEHVEGEGGDAKACREMARVLRPGGRMAISVPFGPRYIEQEAADPGPGAGAERRFFQRIYDPESFHARLRPALTPLLSQEKIVTVGRKPGMLLRCTHGLSARAGATAMGLLGFANPFLSRRLNLVNEGVSSIPVSRYNRVSSRGDIYGDLVWMGTRSEECEER